MIEGLKSYLEKFVSENPASCPDNLFLSLDCLGNLRASECTPLLIKILYMKPRFEEKNRSVLEMTNTVSFAAKMAIKSMGMNASPYIIEYVRTTELDQAKLATTSDLLIEAEGRNLALLYLRYHSEKEMDDLKRGRLLAFCRQVESVDEPKKQLEDMKK